MIRDVSAALPSALHPDEGRGNVVAYLLLFAPFGLAWLLEPVPMLSYTVAWGGSFWILFLTLSGQVRPLPDDRSLFDQIMRPVVLTQLLFAFYTAISSVFYVLDLNGYYYLSHSSLSTPPPGVLDVTAEAQRYYVLAHAGVAAGIVWAMDYRKSGEWVVRPLQNPAAFLLVLSVLAFVGAEGMGEGFGQVGIRLQSLSLVAAVLALALAIPTRRVGVLIAAGAVYTVNMGAAFRSGWKEEVLVMVILLAVFAYPYARRAVLIGAPIALVFLLAVLPTYANIFRSLNWDGTASADEAAVAAFETIRGGSVDLAATNWEFLTGRLSEIGLFTQYISGMELSGRYYGWSIVDQAVNTLVPRLLWPGKPITEDLVMERAYENGVISREAEVSAKPQYVVDGYLSGGGVGVLLAALAYGLLASLASRVAERWFGGYLWGTGLVYTSFFTVFWRGNSFEFMLNTVFWSFVLLVPLFWIGRWTGILVPAHEVEDVQPDVAMGEDALAEDGPRGFWAAG